jgi:TolB-like protein/Flp pilus assembly protein TadD
MQASRWEKIEQVFNEAIAVPVTERVSFVERTCGADDDLRFEVISLLEADSESNEIFVESVFPLVSQLIDSDINEQRKFKKTLAAEINRFPQIRTKRQNLKDYFPALWQHQKVFCMGLIALLFLVSGFIALRYINNENSQSGELTKSLQYQPIKTIAVLPFRNESNNQENEYLSDGVTESIINRLGQLPNLSVKARGSVFQYKGKVISPQDASRELSVQALLLGRIIEYGNNLTITLELVDGITGQQIWGNQYKRTASSLISLQNEIMRDVLTKLQTRLSVTEKEKLDKRYTENVEAYQLYLKGRYYWNKRTASDLRKSTEYFKQAITLDPSFALAYSGLADSYVLFSGYGVATPEESFPEAKESAKKALELDETVAEAHAALGYTLFNYEWNFEESEKHMKRALELNPNYATAHNWYGNANLLAAGRFDEAIETLNKAQKINPLSPITNADLGNSYLFARQIDKAVEQFQKTVEMDGNFYYARAYLGRAYMMKGLFDEAQLELQKAQSLSDDPRILMLMVCNYSKMGSKDKALSVLDQMKDISKKRYVSSYYFALAYTALGKKDEAFKWLEKAYLEREGRMTLIKVDPLLDDLRSDSRFTELMQRVGLHK